MVQRPHRVGLIDQHFSEKGRGHHCLLLQDRAASSEDFKKALASYCEKRAPI
jgi:hypothetical protein